MSQTDRMIEELRRAGLFDKDSAYDGMIGEAVKELILVFQGQGHSGNSAHYTAKLFYNLIEGEILSPLTPNTNEWINVSYPEHTLYQSLRCSHVFMEDGEAYTIEGRVFSDDGGDTFFTNQDSKVYFDLPGYPPKKQYIIFKK